MWHEAWWDVLCRERAIAGCGVHTFPGLLLQSPSSLTLPVTRTSPRWNLHPFSPEPPGFREAGIMCYQNRGSTLPPEVGCKVGMEKLFCSWFLPIKLKYMSQERLQSMQSQGHGGQIASYLPACSFSLSGYNSPLQRGRCWGSIWSPEISAHRLPSCLPGRFTGHSKLGGLLHLNKSLVQTECLPLKMFKNKTLK